ncbi:MAG: InlB B-repeat-containing protein [Bacteroidales bacterium]|jgi:uncharacterized repeat protein (TIGR02543 family)|nr:InlB B-repeat-containing protein [Bacteroidales bacterium]
MKKLLFTLLFVCTCAWISAQQLAFPGAEGFGRYTLGARGVTTPSVYHVTNLDDAGAGSFRDAVSQPGRIVVFDVSGVINLKSRVVFSGNSYIAGHTAPGDGVIIYGNGVSFSGANNLIVRYLRIYMGTKGESGKDAGGVANGKNMIFDHCSFAWGRDETFSISWDNKGTEPTDITLQHSIIGQGLVSHSAGGLIQTSGGVSIIGCLYIDNTTRNPKVKGLNQFINNVVYNWEGSNGYILADSDGPSWAWMEGNYFISGPGSGALPFTRARENFQLFTNSNNNFVDGDKNGTLDGVATVDADYANTHAGSAPTLVTSVTGFAAANCATCGDIPKPFLAPNAAILTPQDALTSVIASAGASLPARSIVDAYMIDQLQTYGTGGAFISGESQNGIYNNVGVVSEGEKAPDTDNDGIPDAWESANGLNPSDASDALQAGTGGYLNIENYLNSINAPAGAPYVRSAYDLKWTARTTTSIDLTWKNNQPDADDIVLQISTDGVIFTGHQTLSASATSFQVTGLNQETFYWFRLETRKSGITSALSEALKVSTEGTAGVPLACTEPAPENGATTRFYTSVDFSWTNETGTWSQPVTYEVYAGETSGALSKVSGDAPITATSFTYTPSTPFTMGATYYWRVDAINAHGTTTGTEWSFVAGTYSFTASVADIGLNCDGYALASGSNLIVPINATGTITSVSQLTPAVSGVTFVAATTSYTVFPDSDNEMTFAAQGGATVNSGANNVYMHYGSGAVVPDVRFTGDAHYLEANLTAKSVKKNIASVTINGTGSSLSATAIPTPVILFSDKIPFDENSIVGYEVVSLPPVRNGAPAVNVPAPVGSKSFRVYRRVTISTAGEDLYQLGDTGLDPQTFGNTQQNRLAYFAANLELVNNDDPNASAVNTISELKINDVKAQINDLTGDITVAFTKIQGPLGTWKVDFTLTDALATANFSSGATYDFSTDVPLTLTVTAENGEEKIYTVTATVADEFKIAMLAALPADMTTDANYDEASHQRFMQFLDGYDVTVVPAGTATGHANEPTADETAALYAPYDLIVVHPTVNGQNSNLYALAGLIGKKAILNLKPFVYTSGSGTSDRWGWTAPANTVAGITDVNVATALQNHPIFNKLEFSGESLALYAAPTPAVNNIQTVNVLPFAGTRWDASWNASNNALATYNSLVQTHEINLGNNAAKYLLLGVSQELKAFALLSDNTVRLLQNAVMYLLNPDGYYDYTTNTPVGIPTDNTIQSLSINGILADISHTSGMAAVTLDAVDEYAVTFALGDPAKATADFVSGTQYDFADGPLLINVTAGNGDVKTYTIFVKVGDGAPKKKIAILNTAATTGAGSPNDDKLLSAFVDYDVTYVEAPATAPDDIAAFFAPYDLIVAHPSVGGSNATAWALRNLVGVKPILNLKAFFYNNGRWSWSTTNPGNAGTGAITAQVPAALQNHNIFEGVSFTGDDLTYYGEPTTADNGIQYAADLTGTNFDATLQAANHVIATYNTTGIQLHEVNLNNAAKYLMLGLSLEGNSYAKFNTNTVKLLKNIAQYLTDASAYYDYGLGAPQQSLSADNNLYTLTVAGYVTEINGNEVSVTLPREVGDLGEFAVVYALNDINATADFASGATHDFASGPLTITVTAGNGSTKVYTVSAEIEAFNFEVDLDPNSGTLPEDASAVIAVTQREPIGPLPTPVKSGYTFTGWNLELDGTGDFFDETTVYQFYSDTTLYAQWSINTYTLSFNSHAQGVAHPESRQVVYGDAVGELPVLSREGYWEFGGWSDSFNDGGEQYAATTPYHTDGDLTLYAIWNPISGIGDTEWADLKVYPNPVTDVVSVSGLEGGEVITFFDINGRRWLQSKASNPKEDISVSHLPKGTYLVKIAKNGVEKVVKLSVK